MGWRSSTLSIFLVLALLVAACGSDDSGSQTGAEESTTTASDEAPDTTGSESDQTAEPDDSGESDSEMITDGSNIDWATVDLTTIDWENIDMRSIDYVAIRDNPTAADLTEETQSIIASRMDPGSATLTIGDMTWEFDEFLCAVGLESTESDVYTLSTNTFGEIDGTQIQMQATIRDDSGEGRLEGDGLVHEIQVDDVSDFENPAVSWRMVADQGIVIDGYELSAEGVFDDGLTPEDDAVPGTLEGTCGVQSRIP